eukprot:5117248-Pyramimonas_sp.AAC.1
MLSPLDLCVHARPGLPCRLSRRAEQGPERRGEGLGGAARIRARGRRPSCGGCSDAGVLGRK